MNKDLSAFPFYQGSEAFSHSPAHVAKNLQTVRTWYQKCKTVVTEDANRFGKTLKGLQIKAGEVKTLELFFRKHAL